MGSSVELIERSPKVVEDPQYSRFWSDSTTDRSTHSETVPSLLYNLLSPRTEGVSKGGVSPAPSRDP